MPVRPAGATGRPAFSRSAAKKWRAILVATLVLVLAFWALLEGLVAEATNDGSSSEVEPNAAIGLAVGLTVIPFVFVALAFLSEHPRPWSRGPGDGRMLVGYGTAAGDAATGIVAGVGAGGIQVLRMDEPQNWRAWAWRWWLLRGYCSSWRAAGGLVLRRRPSSLLTAIGVADHLSELEVQAADPASSDSRASRRTPALSSTEGDALPGAEGTVDVRPRLRSELSGAPPARSRA